LLLRFPTPSSISELSEADFATQAWNLVGRKMHKIALLGEIYALAQRSVGTPVPVDSRAISMFRLFFEQYIWSSLVCAWRSRSRLRDC
jgi:hypothetical protein